MENTEERFLILAALQEAISDSFIWGEELELDQFDVVSLVWESSSDCVAV